MYKRICFIYTETTGLHQTNECITKKNLFCFARLVVLNYEIGYYKDGKYIMEKNIRQIVKPRCMVIPDETVKYHGITQKIANKKGIDSEEIILNFKKDLENVNVIVSHNIDFHLKTIIAEAFKYNIKLEFNNYIIIDTISFYHNYGYIKLKDLANKLKLKKIPEANLEIIRNVFLELYNNYSSN